MYERFTDASREVMRLAAEEEVARLQADGLDAALYASVMSIARKQRIYPNAFNWSQHLVDCLRRKTDPMEILKRRAMIEDIINNEMLNAAARKYFAPDNVMKFMLLPRR